MVQEQDYILDEQAINTIDSFHKYYLADDTYFEWTKQPKFIQGLYIPAKFDDIREYTNDVAFNMNSHYYNDMGQRIYTIEQLKRGESLKEFVPSILLTDKHTEINLNNNKNEFTLPVVETTRILTIGSRLKRIIVNSLDPNINIGSKYVYHEGYNTISTTIKQIIKIGDNSYQLTLIADQNQTN